MSGSCFAIGHASDGYVYKEGVQGEADPQQNKSECSIVGKSLLLIMFNPHASDNK